jgi:hypothetical protein
MKYGKKDLINTEEKLSITANENVETESTADGNAFYLMK